MVLSKSLTILLQKEQLDIRHILHSLTRSKKATVTEYTDENDDTAFFYGLEYDGRPNLSLVISMVGPFVCIRDCEAEALLIPRQLRNPYPALYHEIEQLESQKLIYLPVGKGFNHRYLSCDVSQGCFF